VQYQIVFVIDIQFKYVLFLNIFIFLFIDNSIFVQKIIKQGNSKTGKDTLLTTYNELNIEF